MPDPCPWRNWSSSSSSVIALLARTGSLGVPCRAIASAAPAEASTWAHSVTACRSDAGRLSDVRAQQRENEIRADGA